MTEKKAVLNVTISEPLAAQVRRVAKLEHTTISSVVERALAKQVSWELKRFDGLAAIDAYYKEHGYPTEEERAAAKAAVEEEERLIDEARAYNAAPGGGVFPGATGAPCGGEEKFVFGRGALLRLQRPPHHKELGPPRGGPRLRP